MRCLGEQRRRASCHEDDNPEPWQIPRQDQARSLPGVSGVKGAGGCRTTPRVVRVRQLRELPRQANGGTGGPPNTVHLALWGAKFEDPTANIAFGHASQGFAGFSMLASARSAFNIQ